MVKQVFDTYGLIQQEEISIVGISTVSEMFVCNITCPTVPLTYTSMAFDISALFTP